MTKTRIYICGSHSVGKTTLCRELGKLLGYKVITEAARDIMNARKTDLSAIAKDIEAKNTLQWDIGEEHLRRHEEALGQFEAKTGDFATSYRGIIFDRGIDFLVYGAAFSTLVRNQFDTDATDAYLDALRHSESLVLLLEPHEKLMQADDIRASLDMLTAHKITFGIKVLLEIFGIPYVHLTMPDTLERVKLVRSIVGA